MQSRCLRPLLTSLRHVVTPIVSPHGSTTAELSDDINKSRRLIAECRLNSRTIACAFDDDGTLRPGLSRWLSCQRQMPQEGRRAGCMSKGKAINERSDFHKCLRSFTNVAPVFYQVQCGSQDLEVARSERPRHLIIRPRVSSVAGPNWFGCGVDAALLAVLLEQTLQRRSHLPIGESRGATCGTLNGEPILGVLFGARRDVVRHRLV